MKLSVESTEASGKTGIRVGVSACLLGQEVRFNGGHQRNRFLVEGLSRYFDWVPVCPEVEIGLGTPRETVQLVQIGEGVALRTSKTNVDLTETMCDYAKRRVEALANGSIHGFVLKKDSPSCGMERVKVHQGNGQSLRRGRGLFADALLRRIPNLPVEEEGRLGDPRLRENWVARVFAYHDVKRLWAQDWTVGDLVSFHTRYKMMLLAQAEEQYRELGRLVARAKATARDEVQEQYERIFMQAMKNIATVKRNGNVLEHMLGFFKRDLDAESRRELLSHIQDYRAGFVPLVVPLTMLRYYVRVFKVRYLQNQVYLNPHPKDLALRNYV